MIYLWADKCTITILWHCYLSVTNHHCLILIDSASLEFQTFTFKWLWLATNAHNILWMGISNLILAIIYGHHLQVQKGYQNMKAVYFPRNITRKRTFWSEMKYSTIKLFSDFYCQNSTYVTVYLLYVMGTIFLLLKLLLYR